MMLFSSIFFFTIFPSVIEFTFGPHLKVKSVYIPHTCGRFKPYLMCIFRQQLCQLHESFVQYHIAHIYWLGTVGFQSLVARNIISVYPKGAAVLHLPFLTRVSEVAFFFPARMNFETAMDLHQCERQYHKYETPLQGLKFDCIILRAIRCCAVNTGWSLQFLRVNGLITTNALFKKVGYPKFPCGGSVQFIIQHQYCLQCLFTRAPKIRNQIIHNKTE
jgi:hypothetical protein